MLRWILLIPFAWLQGFSQALFTAPFAHVVKALAADDEQPDPTMEQAFITLIHDWDKENAGEQ